MGSWRKAQTHDRGALCVKIAHRLTLLPPPREDGTPIKILDCFAGDGEIWGYVSRWRDDLDITGIEKDPKRTAPALRGDNRRIMKSMDLNRFDVIDMDAWGQPTDQLGIVVRQGFKGPVFWTFIATYPRGSNLLLDASDIPREWAKIAPTTMFGQGGVFDLWLQLLATSGYGEMVHAQAGSGRHYGCVGYDKFSRKDYDANLQMVASSGVGARYGAPGGRRY